MTAPEPCPVAYCRSEAGHRDLHDIPPCLNTCGPIRPGQGREHDPACPNAAGDVVAAVSDYDCEHGFMHGECWVDGCNHAAPHATGRPWKEAPEWTI